MFARDRHRYRRREAFFHVLRHTRRSIQRLRGVAPSCAREWENLISRILEARARGRVKLVTPGRAPFLRATFRKICWGISVVLSAEHPPGRELIPTLDLLAER